MEHDNNNRRFSHFQKNEDIWIRGGWILLGILAIIQCLFELIIFINHLGSPEITRGAMFEEVSRFLRGLPLYVPPSKDYVPIAYNPLFAVLGGIFSLIFGAHAATLRLVAIVGTVGSGIMIFKAVRKGSGSLWLGILALGLFAGAYRTFDCYVDYAHPDSWMLLMALVGFYILQTRRTITWNVLAITCLCISFWFKQHGAFFACSGILYLTWREGFRKSIPYWVIAVILGPVAYFLAGPRIFGPSFIYYTLQVPGAWSEYGLDGVRRFAHYIIHQWFFLSVLGTMGVFEMVRFRRFTNVWFFSLPFALLTGLLGSFDQSEDNVYISTGVWFIITGTLYLSEFLQNKNKLLPDIFQKNRVLRAGASIIIIGLSFGLNLYDPLKEHIASDAVNQYKDLVRLVKGLDGFVWAPDIGQFPGDIRMPVPVHWVPLEDLVRGPGREEKNNPLVRTILHDFVEPGNNKTYIITNWKLEESPGDFLGFLADYYVLTSDFGDRFKSLRAMPGRFNGRSWPRFLYSFKDKNKPDGVTRF